MCPEWALMENQTRKTDPKDSENGLKMEVTGRGATYILHLACQLPSCLIDENNNRKKKKKRWQGAFGIYICHIWSVSLIGLSLVARRSWTELSMCHPSPPSPYGFPRLTLQLYPLATEQITAFLPPCACVCACVCVCLTGGGKWRTTAVREPRYNTLLMWVTQ